MPDLTALPWRTGSDSGRTVYARVTPEPSPRDVFIGTMDAPELAAEACDSHNAALAARMARERAARKGVTRMTGVTGVQFGDGNTQNNVF